MDERDGGLWARQARHWEWIRPPLRPCQEDLDWLGWRAGRLLSRAGSCPRVLLLGVTPELAGLSWPAGCRVLAVDGSCAMIQRWSVRGSAAPGVGAAVQGNWRALPLREEACDLAVADGSLVLLREAQVPGLLDALFRVLKPGGSVLVRVFVRPPGALEPEEVWRRMEQGGYGSFHVFKFRLLMALQRGNGEVRVGDAWEYVLHRCGSLETLATARGWSREEVRTLEAYRDCASVYWFPTVERFRDVVSARFAEVSCSWPGYEMGECCPTFELCKKQGGAASMGGSGA